MAYGSARGNFRVALAGDCMLTRRLSVFDEPAFLALRDLFRGCDAGFVNLESVVRRPDEGTPGVTRGTYMTTPPELLSDLSWLGVSMVSTANNHAYDYGEGGVLATLRHLEEAGIMFAGSGQNLAEARRPGYLDTRAGRVALIATTATYRPWNAASPQRPDMRGRPGINPLNSSTTYSVDEATFRALQAMSEGLGFEQTRKRNRTHFYSDAEAPEDAGGELQLFGERVVKGKNFGATASASPEDIEDNLRWIKEARRQADWVLVSFHSHQFAHKSVASAATKIDLKEPADFVPAFARAAIDAGADIFVGHGSHTPLGIEIYKGKPIFYSVGNFIFQNESVRSFPAEAYARFGLGHDATPTDFLDARTGGGTKGHIAHEGFWENIAVTCEFRGGKAAEIRVHPIEQGFGASLGQRGRPMLATGAIADRVIARVAELSKTYGVEVRNDKGVGVIAVEGRG
jgi:poly-gamma-glutamate capsule biosynthesis protein CapA/YwtB (metallophosphatase superfamily)